MITTARWNALVVCILLSLVLGFSITSSHTVSMALNRSSQDQIFAGEPTCFENVTTTGSAVYCEATSQGTCDLFFITAVPFLIDECAVKCPQTTAPEVVGAPEMQVSEEPNTNCSFGTDYDCTGTIIFDCTPDATNVVCGTYNKPKSGC